MSERPYRTLRSVSTAEITVKKSVFIASASPANDESEAVAFISQIKKKYSDARHNVSAYLLSDGIMHSSDDGEPSGTGGIPVLGALKNSGMENAVVVVTRYFGGILLGAPGLARAYSSATELALKNCDCVLYEEYTDFAVECRYSDYDRLKYTLDKLGTKYKNTDFSDIIYIEAALPSQTYFLLAEDTAVRDNKNLKICIKGTHFDIS